MDLFAEALDEVSKLLQRDAFAQFRTTDAFLRFKRKWQQEVGHEILDVVSRSMMCTLPDVFCQEAATTHGNVFRLVVQICPLFDVHLCCHTCLPTCS